jgi:hypothetical protein
MDMNKTITISEEDFMRASANIMGSDKLGELLKEHPMVTLLVTMISFELQNELFKGEV